MEIIDWLEANYYHRDAIQNWQTVVVMDNRFGPDEWKAGDPATDILIPWLREHCQGRIVTRGLWMETWVRETNRLAQVYFLFVEDGVDVMNIKLRWC